MKQRMFVALLIAAAFTGAPYAGAEDHMDHMGGAEGTEKMALSAADYIKEAEESGVKVKVSLDNPGEAAPPVFTITLDTHTVDLGQFKIEGITTLRDDAKKSYAATVVSETGSSHHKTITLEFKDADLTLLPYVEIMITGLAGVDERVFRFDAPRF